MFEPSPLPPEAPKGDDDSPSADDAFQPKKWSTCSRGSTSSSNFSNSTCDAHANGDHSEGSVAYVGTSTAVASPSSPSSFRPPMVTQPDTSYLAVLQQGSSAAAAAPGAAAMVAAATDAMPVQPAIAATVARNPADQSVPLELVECSQQLVPPQEQPLTSPPDFCGTGPSGNGHGKETLRQTEEQSSLAAMALLPDESLQQQSHQQQPAKESGSADCIPTVDTNPLATEAVRGVDLQNETSFRSCPATSQSFPPWQSSNAVPVHVEVEASAPSTRSQHQSNAMPVDVDVEVQPLQTMWSTASAKQSQSANGFKAPPVHVAGAPTPSRAAARAKQAVDPKLWPKPVLRAPSLVGHLRLPAMHRINGQ